MTQHVKNELVSVRLDPAMKAEASEVLAKYGLTVSDAVRMLFTRIAAEKALPAGLVVDEKQYDVWFRGKVMEALHSTSPKRSHESVMSRAEAAILRAEEDREGNA